jgi:hypothetical protein
LATGGRNYGFATTLSTFSDKKTSIPAQQRCAGGGNWLFPHGNQLPSSANGSLPAAIDRLPTEIGNRRQKLGVCRQAKDFSDQKTFDAATQKCTGTTLQNMQDFEAGKPLANKVI